MGKNIVSVFIILVLVCTLVYPDFVVDYTDYAVYRFVCENQEHHAALKELERNKAVIFMTPTQNIGTGTDVAFAPHVRDGDLLNHYQNMMPWSQLTDNLEAMIDREGMAAKMSASILDNGFDFTHDDYWTLKEHNAFIDQMIELHPDVCSKKIYGMSSEGRALQVLRITNPNPTGEAKPIIFCDSLLHAREWITAASTTFIITQILNDRVKHATILKTFDLYFATVANPDGYVYSWNTNRLWRKTRARNEKSPFCIGIDPNRNCDIGFGGAGTSKDPCSDVYCGDFPNQAPEVKSLISLLAFLGPLLLSYLSFHSYSQIYLLSYGCPESNLTVPPKQLALQEAIASEMIKACNLAHGSTWKWGNSAKDLYDACGCTSDMASKMAVPYAYTLELRDTGKFGFLLPAAQIRDCGDETYASYMALCNQLIAHHGL